MKWRIVCCIQKRLRKIVSPSRTALPLIMNERNVGSVTTICQLQRLTSNKKIKLLCNNNWKRKIRSTVIVMGVTAREMDDRSSTSGRGVIFLIISVQSSFVTHPLHIEYLYNTDPTSNSSYIVASVFITAETYLPSCCLATIVSSGSTISAIRC